MRNGREWTQSMATSTECTPGSTGNSVELAGATEPARRPSIETRYLR